MFQKPSYQPEYVPNIPKSTQEKEIKREDIFTRVENPFCLEQQKFHLAWLRTAHVFAAYYLYLDFTRQVPRSTALFELFYGVLGGFGLTVGCHRYWTHKSFKAKLPLQILLMILQTIAGQHPIHKWCLEHRIHHKYTDSEADPHNSKRGFWFSHLGWLFLPKRKELLDKLKTFDMSDLESDPIVRFQSRYYLTLLSIFHCGIPIAVFYYFWEMPLIYCVAANYRRYAVSLHITWIQQKDVGEGWHNYHHTFPWDYRASEFGWKLNASTMFIDFFAKIGWAYDLKTVSQTMLRNRIHRTGDESHAQDTKESFHPDNIENDFNYELTPDVIEMMKSVDKPVWGWDDENIPIALRKVTKVLYPAKPI